MTAPAQGIRSYALTLRVHGERLSASVARTGPADPLGVALGRPATEAPRLAMALFPICPSAHAASVRRALSSINGASHVTDEDDALVLAEAAAGAIWRSGVTRAGLLGLPAAAGPVRTARAAFENLLRGRTSVTDAARILRSAWTATAEINARAVECARTITLRPASNAPPRLTEPLDQPGRPGEAAFEATPRPDGPAPRNLAAWFQAQDAYAEEILARFEAAQIRPVAEVNVRDGESRGLALTARGPLRHCIEIEDGRIAAWRADAPTDWNFAPGGPVEAHAVRLEPGEDLEVRAQWLLAAFDPCAPASAHILEAAHA